MPTVSRITAGIYAFLMLIPAAHGQSDPYAPPATYYSTATGTGATLKGQLNSIIDGHTTFSYDAARTILPETDEDPNNPNRMLLVYNRQSHPTVWDSAATWNREHVWPESRGVGSGGPDQSDLHMLRPSLTTINSDRGNLNFGGAYGQTFGVKTDGGATVFYPGDADAGMIARQSFYMDVRYDGADSSTTDLVLATGNPSGASQMGNLTRMIEWHFAAPPDSFERRRNDFIYDNYQHNRNPFVDRPEYAWSIFMNQTNDSGLTLAGATPTANGGTTSNLDLGRVIVGAAVPAAQAVTLNKAGLNGTYYEVTAGGAATSSVTGRYNTFRSGVTGTKSINVGLSTTTVAPGLKSGAVTIDNLDITTGGGPDRGANDGNDIVNVSLSVLNHANPSFFAGSDANSLIYDFGTLAQGATAPSFSFDIFNLPTTVGFTAGLDLDSITTAGAAGAFSTNLAPFAGATTLVAGGFNSFIAALDTAVVGDFSATYTLGFSDENLPGAILLGTMSLTLTGTVEAAAPASDADFDGDGAVDGQDFLAWQRGLGQNQASHDAGDANGDAIVDGLDLEAWSTQFGGPAPPVQGIPEPSTATLLLASIPAAAAWRRRRASRFAAIGA